MHPGEDMVFTVELIKQGFKTALFPNSGVYHKRRTSLGSFFRQVFKFGKTRYIISRVYPETAKWIFLIPSLLVFGALFLIILSFFTSGWVLMPIAVYALSIFIASLFPKFCFKLSLLSIITSAVQITAYGLGYLSSVWKIRVMKKDEYGVLRTGFYPEKV